MSPSPDPPSDPVPALYAGGRVGSVPGVVRRAGQDYAVTVQPLTTPPARLIDVRAGAVDVDAALAEAGAAHLAAVRSASPGLYDGSVLAFERLADDRLVVAQAGYFAMLATCDVLQAEAAGRPAGTSLDALPLRRLAHRLAGDPLRSGAGRAAAVGVSVVTIVPGATGPELLLGRRRPDVATDPGRWHVAPSGMLEPTGLIATVVQELREEVGLLLDAQAVQARLRTLGVVHDLGRLRPDVCLLLRLDRPVTLPLDGEFAAWWRLPVARLGDAWVLGPAALTAPAAGALALTEQFFGSRSD